MSQNGFGRLFRFTSWGESHGPAIGCVVDGCPAGLSLTEADIQFHLDRRKPGQSRFTTQRREPDQVKILSGVFEDDRTDGPLTTGTSIGLMIENVDQRSKDYSEIRDRYRPGHADIAYDHKYGLRDYRGGGRSSARETAMRVAAGAIARKVIPNVKIQASVVQLGIHKIDRNNWDEDAINDNPFFCPDRQAAKDWEGYLDDIRKQGLSVGAVIEVVAEGVPPGLGAPVYAKLDQDLASAMMSINAVKGVEIGSGFATAGFTGVDNADEMEYDAEKGLRFSNNHSGGVLGGISTGQPVVVRFVVKPTSSMLTPVKSINRYGEAVDVVTKGRHDPCVGIRAVPVGEAMMAVVLADHYLQHRAMVGDVATQWHPFPKPE